MSKPDAKPVRECAGCALNLVDHCGLFASPAKQWHRRHCEGFNSPEHLERYRKALEPEGAAARKAKRRAKAALAHTEAHHDGRHRPGRP